MAETPARDCCKRCLVDLRACVGNEVVGYYALTAGTVEMSAAPGRVRRNMPDPFPIVVLERLALERSVQGRLSRSLFRDAGLRVLQAAGIIGTRILLFEAILYHARALQPRIGMVVSRIKPTILMVATTDLRASLAAQRHGASQVCLGITKNQGVWTTRISSSGAFSKRV